jgi:hypothetical protein
MLLILPFRPEDVPVYRHIASLGGVAQHDFLLTGPWGEVNEMEQAFNILKPSFSHGDIFTGDREYSSKNKLFADTVKWLDSVGNEEAFYWFDNSIPVKTFWLSDINLEYRTKRTPYLGAVEPSAEVDPATGKRSQENPRLISSSIYPSDVYHRSTLIRQLSFRPNAPLWNAVMRFEIRREATVSSHIQMIGEEIQPSTGVIAGTNDLTILEPRKKEKDHARK